MYRRSLLFNFWKKYTVRYINLTMLMTHTNLNQFFASEDYEKILDDDSISINSILNNGKFYIRQNSVQIARIDIEDIENVKYYDGQNNLMFEGTCMPINTEHLSLILKNGKFYENNTLIYDGDIAYCVGEIVYHGNGKAYRNGEMYYDGEWKYNDCHGKGIAYENGIILYDGYCWHNERRGTGRGYKNNAMIYEGEWLHDERHGYGTQYNNGIVYEGYWEHNACSGRGKQYSNGNLVFDGSYFNSERHGYGAEYRNGVLIFEGEWSHGYKNGEGTSYDGDTSTVAVWKFGELVKTVLPLVPIDEVSSTENSVVTDSTETNSKSESSTDSDDSVTSID